MTTQGMRPKGKQLTRLYKGTVKPYEDFCDSKWKWETGEKNRILKSYIMFCENHNERNSEKIEHMIDEFINYCQIQAAKWLEWDEASRLNYLGFVCRKDDMAVYAAKKNAPSKEDAKTKNVAGTKTEDEWDF